MTYVLSVYTPADVPCKDGEFIEIARASTLWALRGKIRDVRRYYDDISFAIDRHPDEPPSPAQPEGPAPGATHPSRPAPSGPRRPSPARQRSRDRARRADQQS